MATTTRLRTTLSLRTLGTFGMLWALSYVPIHLYWAWGGTTDAMGITGGQDGFRVANWGASVVIVGAGLTCLALTRPWGAHWSGAVLRGAAWVGGSFALVHWVVYSGFSALRLTGVVAYESEVGLSVEQLRRFDWMNLVYFESWFGVMGLLLLVLASRSRAVARLRGRPAVRPLGRFGALLSIGGVLLVLWGVFTFDPWIFAGYGPALLGAGLVMSSRHRDVPSCG